MKTQDSMMTKDISSVPAHAQRLPFSPRPFAEPAASEVTTAAATSPHYSLQNISFAIQPKLTIGQPNDKYEQEADRVAEQVVQRINSPQFSATGLNNPDPNTARNGKPKLQLKPILQRRSAIEGDATPDLESSINRARGGGQPLDSDLQRKMGRAMGADFSRVKVHTDAQSDQLNKSIQAKAFTTGQDVFFRQGAYEPSSRGGQELIAHELTHVVQQNGVGLHRKLSDSVPVPLMVNREVNFLQRDLVNQDAAARSNITGQDVAYEIIAHRLAYTGTDGAGDWLASQGYRSPWGGTVEGIGLFVGLLLPIMENSNVRPVLAFKGTTPSQLGDVLADLDPSAVGFLAFKANQTEIQALIGQAGGGKVDVVGHSLGGALAQHAASAFPALINKVITFQAPGISQEQVRQFNNILEDERPEVRHHIATGDVVDLAGGKHLGGSGMYTGRGNASFFLHDIGQYNPGNHTKYLLQDGQFSAQQAQVGIDQRLHEQIGIADKIGSHAVQGGVKQYNDNPFWEKQFITERAREGASIGGALGIGGAALAKQGLVHMKTGGVGKKILGAGEMLVGGVGALAGGAGALVGGAAGALVGAAGVGAAYLGKGIKATGGLIADGAQATWNGARTAGNAITNGAQATWNGARTAGNAITNGASRAFNSAKNFFGLGRRRQPA